MIKVNYPQDKPSMKQQQIEKLEAEIKKLKKEKKRK